MLTYYFLRVLQGWCCPSGRNKELDTTFTGKQVLIGLPESGKSTFIGALWHVVDSEEIPDTLKLHNLGTDREYIESLREAWLTQNKPERNKLDERHLVWMQLKQAGSDNIAEIVFPDLAGELFEQQWRERIWTNDYFDLITESSGLLVFVHADHQHLAKTSFGHQQRGSQYRSRY